MAKFKPGEMALVVCAPKEALDGTSKFIGTEVVIREGPWENTDPRFRKGTLWYSVTGFDGEDFSAAERVLFRPPPSNGRSQEYSLPQGITV